jgi:hypothetical protein
MLSDIITLSKILDKRGFNKVSDKLELLIRKYSFRQERGENSFYLDWSDLDFPEIAKKTDDNPTDFIEGMSDILESYEPASYCYFDSESSSIKIIIPICEIQEEERISVLKQVLRDLETVILDAGYMFYYDENVIDSKYGSL